MIAVSAWKFGLIKDDRLTRNMVKKSIQARIENDLKMTASALPMICMHKKLLEEFRELSHQFEVALQPSIAVSHNEAFDKADSKQKFCAVDTQKLFEDQKWRTFFSSLTP